MDYLSGMSIADDWQLIAHGSKKKDAAELERIHPRLKISHSEYQAIIRTYETSLLPTSYSDAEKTILIDHYEHPPTKLNKLIQARRNDHELDCCPYCGYPYAPDTLDHFIPKDQWPEFSFLPNNLVPQCRGCAPIKGSNYYCIDNNTCLYVHPIFSDLISRISIHVSINFDDKKTPHFNATFSITNATPPELDRATLHLQKIKVKSRVENYCSIEFSRLKRHLKKRNFDIRDLLKATIEKKMELDGRALDWQCALYQAIYHNHASITYLHSFRKNNNPPPQTLIETTINI